MRGRVGEGMKIQWHNRSGIAPPFNKRVLIYSPGYPEDHYMHIRVMDGEFFKYAPDATHWAHLPEGPDVNTSTDEQPRENEK